VDYSKFERVGYTAQARICHNLQDGDATRRQNEYATRREIRIL